MMRQSTRRMIVGMTPPGSPRSRRSLSSPRSTEDSLSRQSSRRSADKMDKFKRVDQERQRLLDEMYTLPSWSREIAWCCLIVISITACFTAIIYGLSFDLEVHRKANSENPHAHLFSSECWNTSLVLRLENKLSLSMFWDEFLERIDMNASSYGGSDSTSWLLALFQSVALSLVLWQPLTIYVVTWIKIWMFTWNLPIEFPGQCPCLIMRSLGLSLPRWPGRCCCGSTDADKPSHDLASTESPDMDSPDLPRSESIRSKVVANTKRPRDILFFLAKDDMVVDDTEILYSDTEEPTESQAEAGGTDAILNTLGTSDRTAAGSPLLGIALETE